MGADYLLLLLGTIGFFALVAYGGLLLRRWPLCVSLLAVSLLGGYLFIGSVRLFAQGHWLSEEDTRVINGAAPWMALSVLTSIRWERRRAKGE